MELLGELFDALNKNMTFLMKTMETFIQPGQYQKFKKSIKQIMKAFSTFYQN